MIDGINLDKNNKMKANSDFLSTNFAVPVVMNKLDLSSPERFFNRELSWLDFNYRVLEEANNIKIPLLERIRFLSISGTNLDEFYSVRVAGWRQLLKSGSQRQSEDGKKSLDQLRLIDKKCRKLISYQSDVNRLLMRAIENENIAVLTNEKLTEHDLGFLKTYFFSNVFSVLSPLAIDPAHPFPFIPNSGLALALELEKEKDGSILRALLPVPSQINRFIKLPLSLIHI